MTRLPFIDRTRTLFRDFIDGKSVSLNRTPNYELEGLPSPIVRANQQTSLPGVRAIPSATVAALFVSGRADRLWSAKQEGAWDAEHTRSNLG